MKALWLSILNSQADIETGAISSSPVVTRSNAVVFTDDSLTNRKIVSKVNTAECDKIFCSIITEADDGDIAVQMVVESILSFW